MHRIGPRNSWGRLGGKMVSPFLPKQKAGPGAEATGALTASRRPASNQSAGKGVAPIKVGHMESMEGNMAAAHVAYGMSETAFIYPISPATSMGEHVDAWAAQGRVNCFGQPLEVTTMQSEAGAAGAVHGGLVAGGLSTTFTASQGLLLMIPNLYLIAGELMPTVFHVSARAVAKHALTIFNDHSDVMACRQTGFALLSSNSVQEIMDLGLVSHLASMKSRIPFMHFFDGYRTSAQVNKINVIPYEAMQPLIPMKALDENLRSWALNPVKPIIRGTGQRPDIFMTNSVAAQKYYDACPAIVQETMDEVGELTGRHYKLYDYYGHPEAERVTVAMGSATRTLEETCDYLNARGEKVGVMKVRLFRPFAADTFVDAFPKTAKRISVLDRTREEGAMGMPLYLDTTVAFSEAGDQRTIVGGQFGLASREFTPAMAKAVYDNLKEETPRNRFVVGIDDDVTHTSLDYGEEFNCLPEGTKQCVFWGFGTDGTVGANKQAIKTIGTQTDQLGQGHFAYDSHKGGGVTMSHLRFGPEPIKGEYEIQTDCDYIACHNDTYVHKFDMLKPIKQGGTFVLNWGWGEDQLDARLPNKLKEQIANGELEFYTIDASKIALDAGLGQRVNMVLQAVFYHLSEVLPQEESMDILKQDIEKTYGKKGPKIVQMNKDCVDQAVSNLRKFDYPAAWKSAQTDPTYKDARGYGVMHQADQFTTVTDRLNEDNCFVENIMHPVTALEGESLPVSAFVPGGYMPSGTTQYEKRGIATEVPVWIPDTCTQCNYCTIVCPHAVIRPFLFNKQELQTQPAGFETRKAQGGAELGGLNYSIQLATMDCTGCEVCVKSCPDDSLYMAPFSEAGENQVDGWNFSLTVPNKGDKVDKFSVKGSQFQEPLMEFSGACSGCGETPYVKLLTQLYGDRLMIANASGCSSVWGGTSTTNPYSTLSESHDHSGRGPAWGRSLFEDNAEYGLGMHLATLQRRRQVQAHVENALEDESITMSPELRKAFAGWLGNYSNRDKQSLYADSILGMLPDEAPDQPLLEHIHRAKDMIPPISNWLIGGDGWAYDIGFGGLDHVLAKGENVNIMILDTEMYSNTGGQVSKSTQQSAAIKFASGGKQTAKKDMGQVAMMYENIYVASIAMGANYKQSLDAIKEAEEYEGPSMIMAYSPCIDWGIDMSNMMSVQKAAVDAGYWPLYRYDPRKTVKGEPPFQLDSKKIKTDLADFLMTENRFGNLIRSKPDRAKELQEKLGVGITRRMHRMQRSSMDEFELLDALKKAVGEEASGDKITILYASETGNTQDLAKMLAYEMKRRDVRTSLVAYDDYDVADLAEAGTVINLVATCGQGEWPANSRAFWTEIQEEGIADLSELKIATFAMGDSGYVFYNTCGEQMHNRMVELGAQDLMPLGMGDDQDEDKWETAWEEWSPELWNELGTAPPPQELLPASHLVKVTSADSTSLTPESPFIIPQDAVGPGEFCPLVEATPLTPLGRDVRHFSWDISETNITYEVGDALGIWSTNQTDRVSDFLDWYGLKLDDIIEVEDIAESREPPLPSVMTAKQLFCQCLDIFGRPKRQFYEVLSILATDEKEKAQLTHLLEKDGKGELRELIDDTKTYADLLQMFPSADMPLEYMIDFIPVIKPRLYSIASAPEMYPDHIHLCVVEEDWENKAGEQKRGQSTWFLRNTMPGLQWGEVQGQHSAQPTTPYTSGLENWQNVGNLDDSPAFIPRDQAAHIPVRVNSAVVHPPPRDVPLVVVGLGTGIAPFRSFFQQRQIWREEGKDIGDVLLYFGARYEATEFLYGNEMYDWVDDGLITEMKCAFSRDQEEKVYAQHRIVEDPAMFYDYMVTRGGYFYLCGPAGNMPAQVEAACVEAISKGAPGGMPEDEAQQMVTDWKINGRYNVEVW